jgi:hypothetical protein
MPIPFKGGCHCGAVRYVASEDPITIINCHCGDCQKIAGAPFITGVFLPDENYEASVTSQFFNLISRHTEQPRSGEHS